MKQDFCHPIQVQAIEMYGAAQPDFFKSETNGGLFVCLFEWASEATNDFVTPRNERPWCGI